MKICCIKNEDVNPRWISGTCALNDDLFSYIKDDKLVWIERALAEVDSGYKQLIPYIVIQNSAGDVLTYMRHGGEKRLSGLYSCGMGGHIDEKDKRQTLRETVEQGMFRELKEEIANFDPEKLKPVYKGIIYDNETEVGRVHLGIVYFAQCPEGFTPLPSEETSGASWKTLAEIAPLEKESWSRLAFEI